MLHLNMDSSALLIFIAGFVFTQGIQVDVSPKEILVLPGRNVTIMCRASVPLQYCRVEIPGMSPLNLIPGLANSDVSYYGSGLSDGQCGVMITRVTEKNNGPVKCMLGVLTEAFESTGTVQLVVAKAPMVPEMTLSTGADSMNIYKINDILQASCLVRNGRPVANISWFLNDDPLYNSEVSMPTVFALAKENLQSKIQNMTRTLQAADNGKLLKCVAYHPAYPTGRQETSRQLEVKYPPLPQNIEPKFGYVVGQPGLITVVVEANPKPIIEWDIGNGEKLREHQTDRTGRMEAEEVQVMGKGRYAVGLRIAAIHKEDTERTYSLRAYNDMGEYEYRVMISTSPEPEGIELGIGGIIGIIVSILIILLFVFLLIFAKVTGRWCFSEPADGRNLGESSDTESAEVRHREQKPFPPIKLTQLFKKNKDRVATSEETEPKKVEDDAKTPLEGTPAKVEEPPTESETKEGALVYAELDLVSPASVKPVVKNDNERTEYAEIVYTPQDEKKV